MLNFLNSLPSERADQSQKDSRARFQHLQEGGTDILEVAGNRGGREPLNKIRYRILENRIVISYWNFRGLRTATFVVSTGHSEDER
jgi:hypothetical protein